MVSSSTVKLTTFPPPPDSSPPLSERVTQAAAEVSRLVHEAHDLKLLVGLGVREGENETRSSAGRFFLRRCCHD